MAALKYSYVMLCLRLMFLLSHFYVQQDVYAQCLHLVILVFNKDY